MSPSPPLRFLALVLGGWAAARTAILAPPWPAPPAGATAAAPRAPLVSGVSPRREAGPKPASPGAAPRERPRVSSAARAWVQPRPGPGRLEARPAAPLSPGTAGEEAPPAKLAALAVPPPSPPHAVPARPAAAPGAPRWSLSAWSFVRRGDSAPLAAGGLLGGSQAGARLLYRLSGDPKRPLAISARLSSPLRSGAGAEAAVGLDWRPSRRMPVHLLVERRQALGAEGRSAFGLTLYGGVGDAPLGRFRIDAYVQAGIVGARSRDPFADGALRLSLPAGGRLRLGAGAWAAAQPGVARLDLGPQAALRLPVAGRAVTLAADWRLRVAGNAEPGSGPTLTVATDF